MSRLLSPDELMPEYRELLSSGAKLPLVVSGGSMTPFLKHERDTVLLGALTEEPKKGDILFFRRSGGAYVLHRLVRNDGAALWLVGDAQDEIEGPIMKEQAFAKVIKVRRNGKELSEKSLIWQFYKRIWPLTTGHRKRIFACVSKLRRFFGRKG